MTPTQTHAALLSEEELVTCIVAAGCLGKVKLSYESGPFAIDRPTLNASRLYNAIEQALLAKLQPAQDPLNLSDPAVQKRLAAQWGYVMPAQAGELPDEREAFERAARAQGWRDEDFRLSSRSEHNYTYRYASTEQCWQFWQARAALAARKPLTDEQRSKVFRDAESRMVYDLNLSWRNAVVDEVERAHGINGLEVKT